MNELDKIEIMIQENTLGATETALQRGVDRAMKDIENAYKGAGVPTVGLDFDTINADTMKYITQRFGEDGLVLSDRIWRFAGRQREALEGAIRAGILQGKALNEMRRDIERIYSTNRYNVDRLIKTEMNTAYRVAFSYSAQRSRVVEYVQIIRGEANQPKHRCTQLSKMDKYGKGNGVFKTTDTEIYNPHPNCTSYLLYVLDEDAVDFAKDAEDKFEETNPTEDERLDFNESLSQLMSAQSVKEIEDLLKRQLPEMETINLKDFDLEYGREAAARLLILRERYPEVYGTTFRHFETMQSAYTRMYEHELRRTAIYNLKRNGVEVNEKTIASITERIKKAGIVKKRRASSNTNGVAWYGSDAAYKGFFINKKVTNDFGEAAAARKNSKASGWHSVDKAAGTVTHEFGHIIDYRLRELAPTERDELIEGLYEKYSQKAIEHGDIYDYWRQNLSQYGGTKPVEFFAEAFAEYFEEGDNARPIAKEVGAGVEEIFKKIRGQS